MSQYRAPEVPADLVAALWVSLELVFHEKHVFEVVSVVTHLQTSAFGNVDCSVKLKSRSVTIRCLNVLVVL